MKNLDDLKILRANMRQGIDCLRLMVTFGHGDEDVHQTKLQTVISECLDLNSMFDSKGLSLDLIADWRQFQGIFARFNEVVEEAKALIGLWGKARADTARLDLAAQYVNATLCPVSMSALSLLNTMIAKLSEQAAHQRFSSLVLASANKGISGQNCWEFPWDQAATEDLAREGLDPNFSQD